MSYFYSRTLCVYRDTSYFGKDGPKVDAMKAGWWEVRRCKSWEANPRAIWSLMID